jgi:Fic family protein
MGRIRIPPALKSLTDSIAPAIYAPLIAKYGPTDAKGRYLHWNEFKWRVDQGDDEKSAWLATKISRQVITEPLAPLHATIDRPFIYCVPTSLNTRLHHIDQMTGGGHSIGSLSYSSANFNHRYLVKTLMMEEAITSSQLEGASTTRNVAEEMLRKNLKPQDKSQQMILNNFLLMKRAVELKDEALSIDLILDLHRIATFDAIENHAIPGELRQDDNIIISDLYHEIIHQPPPWESIKYRLTELCEFANYCHDGLDSNPFIHPMIKAIVLHFMIGYIHPFGDGNGRTARALFYWSILKSGYWLFEYVSISRFIQEKRSSYDTAFIYTETDDFDMTYFLYHQVDVIEKAVLALHDYLDRKRRDYDDFLNWIDHSQVARSLSSGQLEILKEAVKEPGKEFTAKQVALDCGVTENTARSYLNALVAADLLFAAKRKNGKMVHYLAPATLKDKLRRSSS